MPMTHCQEYDTLTRCGFLTGGTALLSRYAREHSLIDLRQRLTITLTDPHVGPRGDTLVCVFLRGGADGLNIVVPHGDEEYYRARPTLSLKQPDSGAIERNKALNLDGFFGLHPALEGLHYFYQAGVLAAVHAVGSPDTSHSHFQAMAELERGAFGGSSYSGWLARHLATLDTGNESALRAVAVGEMLPTSLAGSAGATAMRSVDAFRLAVPENQVQGAFLLLSNLYVHAPERLVQSAAGTLAAIKALNAARLTSPNPYPETGFGAGLNTVETLIRAEIGVEVACLDLGGWDTHAAQGAGEGTMAARLKELGDGLAAFMENLGERSETVTVVVMSEFGRRVRENAALGTDHGSGSMMLLLGGGIAGGKVYGEWPGLSPDLLAGPGDLTITTDYRDVLAEIVFTRLRNPRLIDVFPGYTPTTLGVAQVNEVSSG